MAPDSGLYTIEGYVHVVDDGGTTLHWQIDYTDETDTAQVVYGLAPSSMRSSMLYGDSVNMHMGGTKN